MGYAVRGDGGAMRAGAAVRDDEPGATLLRQHHGHGAHEQVLRGVVDLQLLDFVLFDWDCVLRPSGLLWMDMLACVRKDLDDYMYMFL